MEAGAGRPTTGIQIICGLVAREKVLQPGVKSGAVSPVFVTVGVVCITERREWGNRIVIKL